MEIRTPQTWQKSWRFLTPGQKNITSVERAAFPQVNSTQTLQEEISINQVVVCQRWNDAHPVMNQIIPNEMDRKEQVVILRLRMGHNRMSVHLYKEFNKPYL